MMLPLCIRMICLDTLRPMPEPFGLVVKKGTKILAATSAGYAAAVVGHVDGHLLGLGTIGGYDDLPVRFSGHGMSGVFQQIQHHLSDQVLVGIDQQIARSNTKPNGSIFLLHVRFGQFRHALEKRFYIERRGPGSRNAGYLAIGFHEADQGSCRSN